jgi:predicted enzyme related to lactoylglutathione lyase
MPGSFVHLELNTDDTDRAKEFYKQLFGWDYLEWPMGEHMYWGVKTPEPPGGGIQTNPMPHAPAQWVPYVSVDDVRDTVARARTAGAEILVDFMEIGGAGELAVLRDPSGATLGLWKQTAPTNGQSASASAGGKKKSGAKKAGAKKAGAKKAGAKKAAAKKGGKKKAGKAAAPKAKKKAGKKAGKKKG